MSTDSLTAEVVLGVLAGVLVAAALVVFLRARAFVARAESSMGEVVAVRPYRERMTSRYIQVFRFETAGGTMEAELKAGLPYQVGDRVQVFFEPSNPGRVRVKAELVRPMVVLLVFAGLALLGCLEALFG